MKTDKSTIELDAEDSALVLKSDGSLELCLASLEEDAEISEETYIIAGLSIAFTSYRDDLKAFVDGIFEKQTFDEPDSAMDQ